MACEGCPVHQRLNPLDERISDFYHEHGILTHGEITLHAFDEILSIRVIHRPGKTYTVKSKETWNVWLDSTLNLPERRVRMSHEIAHMLRHMGSQFFSNEIIRLKQEEQAKRFALYALAPTCFLLPLLRDDSDNPNTFCAELADAFGVPVWFMKKRLDRLRADTVMELMHI